jgi:Flp pilus assembly protein TadD
MLKQYYLNKAKNLIAEGKYADCIPLLQKAIKRKEASISYLYSQLAWVKMKAGKLEDALNDFDKAIELEPANAHYISERAVCKHLMGKTSLALLDFDYALKLEPNNPYRYASRAFIKDCIGDTEGAIADYLKAIELDPYDSIAYNNLGLLEEKLGRIESAKKRFKKADELEKINPHKGFVSMPLNIENKVESNADVKEEQLRERRPTYLSVITSVFTSKQGFIEFFNFIKRGFRIK